jgi:CTP:molybdopterin cytidylyltransferase MocA
MVAPDGGPPAAPTGTGAATRASTAAIVLAAGGGSRFEGPTHKLLAPMGGARVVDHAVEAARQAGLDATYLVTGAVAIEPPAGTEVVVNEAWAEGLATSLTAGVAAARAAGHHAVVVGLGDAPGTTAEAWRRVAAAVDAPVAVATYQGVRGHPVRLAAEVWDLLPTAGDTGARELLAGRHVPVVEVPCPGSPADIDTMEDLTAWS